MTWEVPIVYWFMRLIPLFWIIAREVQVVMKISKPEFYYNIIIFCRNTEDRKPLTSKQKTMKRSVALYFLKICNIVQKGDGPIESE